MSARAARDVVGSVVSFVAPPFGLEPLVDFSLEGIEGAVGLYALRSDGAGGVEGSDGADVRLFVLDAAVHLPDYSPVVTDEQSDALDLQDAGEALLLVVATPAASGMTVNLLAPIVVNVRTGAGAQLILEGQDWPLRAELSPQA
jgi:flagellar assembly factor FliW